jgi:hypothetical protein
MSGERALFSLKQYRSYRSAVFCSETGRKLRTHQHPVPLIEWKYVNGKSESCSDFAWNRLRILLTKGIELFSPIASSSLAKLIKPLDLTA